LQPLVHDDVLTENHHVADWTPDLDPVNNTITVNGVISDIKHYNFASGRQYPLFLFILFFVQLISKN
jgi:hypothetical protein